MYAAHGVTALSPSPIRNVDELAEVLAGKTHFLSDIIRKNNALARILQAHFESLTNFALPDINKTQYFDLISESSWQFYVGGYQPLQKYLKDRQGRVLTFEEVEHYQDAVSAIEETREIMQRMG